MDKPHPPEPMPIARCPQRLSIRADGNAIEVEPSELGPFVRYEDYAVLKNIAQRLLTSECFQKPTHGIWLELHNAVMPEQTTNHAAPDDGKQARDDRVNSANVRCNACERSLVGVTTGNAGCDTQCKPHGLACGLYRLKAKAPDDVKGQPDLNGLREIRNQMAKMSGKHIIYDPEQQGAYESGCRNAADMLANYIVQLEHARLSAPHGWQQGAEEIREAVRNGMERYRKTDAQHSMDNCSLEDAIVEAILSRHQEGKA